MFRGAHTVAFLTPFFRFYSSVGKNGTILKGLPLAKKMLENVKEGVEFMKSETGKSPRLCIISTGDDPASNTYINQKKLKGESVGIHIQHEIIRIDTDKDLPKLSARIHSICDDSDMSGVIIQLPIIDSNGIILHHAYRKAVDVLRQRNQLIKDVDGMHPCSEALYHYLTKKPNMFSLSCTPAAVLQLLEYHNVDIIGKRATIIGRSSIVGLPLINHLLCDKYKMTISSPHITDPSLELHTKNADLLIVAAGHASLVLPSMIKENAILIDIGINRVTDSSVPRGYKLVGDIDASCYSKSKAYTPVPGGIGPVTVAQLMQNTLHAALVQHSLPIPESIQNCI